MIASILPQPSFLILTISFNCLQATNSNLFYSVYSSSLHLIFSATYYARLAFM